MSVKPHTIYSWDSSEQADFCYQHYKGQFYEVVGVARHSETLEELVVYRALYESKEFGTNALWVRPKSRFQEYVNIEGKEIPRFKYVG